ncbi:MAG: DNA polymerase IV [Actinomycetota bacterium]
MRRRRGMMGSVATRPPEPILHVDMDAFYASVEALKDPSLAGKPVAVGGSAARGVVMSASYEARRHGVRSAMPSVRARRLCPELIFVHPDFDAYRAASNQIRQVMLSFTPVVEPLSLDEAFLDVGGAVRLFGEPPEIARKVRAAILEGTSLTASVGVAPNKFLAKLASDAAKPDGIVHVPADGVRAFLDPLPVNALWGVGERTHEVLLRLGVRTVAELAATSPVVLERALGDQSSRHLGTLARGEDDRAVVPYDAPKSVSHEETFERDVDDDDEVLREVLRLSHRVAARLRADGYRARTVTLKIRLSNFTTLTRSRTLPDATDSAADLHRVGAELYASLPFARRRIRLLGVAGTGLVPAGAAQLARYRAGRWPDAERALDRIDERFGRGSAFPAALLRRGPAGPFSRP